MRLNAVALILVATIAYGAMHDPSGFVRFLLFVAVLGWAVDRVTRHR